MATTTNAVRRAAISTSGNGEGRRRKAPPFYSEADVCRGTYRRAPRRGSGGRRATVRRRCDSRFWVPAGWAATTAPGWRGPATTSPSLPAARTSRRFVNAGSKCAARRSATSSVRAAGRRGLRPIGVGRCGRSVAVKAYDNGTALPMIAPMIGPGDVDPDAPERRRQRDRAGGALRRGAGHRRHDLRRDVDRRARRDRTERHPSPDRHGRGVRRVRRGCRIACARSARRSPPPTSRWRRSTTAGCQSGRSSSCWCRSPAFTGAARLPIGPLWADEDIRRAAAGGLPRDRGAWRGPKVCRWPATSSTASAATSRNIPPTMRSSLLIDLSMGKRIEVEALQGAVVRRAARLRRRRAGHLDALCGAEAMGVGAIRARHVLRVLRFRRPLEALARGFSWVRGSSHSAALLLQHPLHLASIQNRHPEHPAEPLHPRTILRSPSACR